VLDYQAPLKGRCHFTAMF
jgi:hypothetical protein